MRRLTVLLLSALALSGCGSDDADRIRADVEERVERAQESVERTQARARRLRDRVVERVERVLEEIEKAVPEAPQGSIGPRAGGAGSSEIEAYLTEVIEDVDRYWTRTLRANGRPEPRVGYSWVSPGDRQITACDVVSDDRAAFYCPADDTIYIAQVFAAELYQGLLRGLPGEAAGYGRAAGDFAVAYVVAHEYAHNLQQELGVFDNSVGAGAKPFELQADCMAGTWAYSVFAAGELQPGDLEEATNAALAVGDFDFGNAQHHGTPDERRAALLTGYESGDPSVCSRFLPS